MLDSYGRSFRYLRVSLIDICNLSCSYCKAPGDIQKANFIDPELILRLASVAVELGMEKIRLSGGEPLLYPQLFELVRKLKEIKGIKELAITTNGLLLEDLAEGLCEAGVDRINISLDSLDKDLFKEISGKDGLEQVLSGIDRARQLSFKKLKLNTVLLGGINDSYTQIKDMIDFAQEKGLYLRFIELMRMGPCALWENERFVSTERVLELFPELRRLEMDGVAELYSSDELKVPIGLIRVVSHKFCDSCSRLRLTADGKIKTCLHSAAELSIKYMTDEELKEALKHSFKHKEKQHLLDLGEISKSLRSMDKIGG